MVDANVRRMTCYTGFLNPVGTKTEEMARIGRGTN